ncbi:hypothetical protein FQN51_006803 [Onygenales sp. PD_10]|nr:hypothetical protein FQN51_006803 [Onygenales sp. PD_10]
MPDTLQTPTSWLSDMTKPEMDFVDSSFFRVTMKTGQKCLPAPSEVTARSTDFKNTSQPTPVRFEHLNLIVKFGPRVTVEEALCLHMIRRILPDKVPVPEVYGWKVEGGTVFIYMELIQGETLHDRWDSLSGSDRSSICDELHEIISSLRQVGQDPTDPFIGSIARRPLLDYVFESMPSGGPFKNIKEFNDWFSALPQHWVPDSRKYPDPYRKFLPDTGAIKLTHGDLHRGNIMISSTSPPRVLAVVDWAHAGWYPDYWEYCKALYTSHYNDEWRTVWIPKFLSPYTMEYDIFAEYINQMGAI